MPTSFEAAWKEHYPKHQYGPDAMEQVRLGYELAQKVREAEKPEFMPVIGTRRTLYVPMEILSPEQALQNHSQSLKRLAERGGMGLGEIIANIYRRPLHQIKMDLPADTYLHELKKIAERMGRL